MQVRIKEQQQIHHTTTFDPSTTEKNVGETLLALVTVQIAFAPEPTLQLTGPLQSSLHWFQAIWTISLFGAAASVSGCGEVIQFFVVL